MKESKGKVYIVGAGPGHPELMSLRAKKVLSFADVVLYDNLVSEIVLSFCPHFAKKIFVGKSAGKFATPQSEINRLLVKYAKQGLNVVRVKGGDPLIFGRGSEEAYFVAENNIEFEIVPGITSAIGASSYAGIPLTHRGLVTNIIFLTAHEDPNKEKSQIDWKWLANSSNSTIVIYMGSSNLEKVVTNLVKNGINPNSLSSAIQDATLPSQVVISSKLINLAEQVKKNKLSSPLLIIISPNVGFHQVLNWYEKKPLFGKKIIITRPSKQNQSIYLSLLDEGAEPILIELIQTTTKMDVSITEILKNDFDWIIFTSENGVHHFFQKMFSEDVDVRAIGRSKVAALGIKTALELKKYCIYPDFVPKNYDSHTFINEFLQSFNIKDAKILRVKGNFTKDPISLNLAGKCKLLQKIDVYEISNVETTSDRKSKITHNNPDGIIFTASLIVERFFEAFGREDSLDLLNKIDVFSIGPNTESKLLELGVKNVITSKVHTIEGIIGTIKEHYHRGK